MLTLRSGMFYAESLKLVNAAFAPVRFANFLYLPDGRMIAENISNIGRAFVNSFSESAHFLNLKGLSKKVNEMTNTIINTTESTLQSLYRYYSEIKSTWYKGNYTIEQEDVYCTVFNALEDALVKLPPQCLEDRKIKYEMIKDVLTNDGDLSVKEMSPDRLVILQTINTLAAE